MVFLLVTGASKIFSYHNPRHFSSSSDRESVSVSRHISMPPHLWGCCDYCGFGVGKSGHAGRLLAKHIGREHDWRLDLARIKEQRLWNVGNSSNQHVTCDPCKTIAEKRHIFSHFLRNHHGPDWRLDLARINKRRLTVAGHPSTQRVACDSCNAAPEKRSLFRHFLHYHIRSSIVAKQYFERRNVLRRRNGRLAMTCDKCQVTLSANSSGHTLFEHWLRIHTPNQPRQYVSSCDDCAQQCTSKSNLSDHILARHNFANRWTADIFCRSGCGQTFAVKMTEARHQWNHHTVSVPYVCDPCSRDFMTKGGLLLHIQHSCAT